MKSCYKNQNDKIRIDQLIEKYRFYIGGGLLVLIIVGGTFLLWRENYSKPNLESRISNQESKIADLEEKLSKIKESGGDNQTNDNPPVGVQNPSSQTEPQGQVAGSSTSEQPSQPVSKPASPQQISGKININTASASQLDSLPGIGKTYAERIIEYRNSHGGFKSVQEIKNVKGIGDKTFDKFKDQITI